MKTSVSRSCLLIVALGIVVSPFETASASFGDCLVPSGIEIPKRLRTEQEVGSWRSNLETYSVEIETYLKCLAVYANQNKSQMTNREINELRQASRNHQS